MGGHCAPVALDTGGAGSGQGHRGSETIDPGTIIATLGMVPHPEGGHYVETYRAPCPAGERPACTAIYFLLVAGERSRWHRVDAVETWLWHAGSPLGLAIGSLDVTLGPELARGQRPQAVVPEGAWQSAESRGAWTLVSCVVAPGFSFAGLELAPPGWVPPGR